MKVGYIILCRFGSSRLPGKILREINGRAILELILERLSPLGKENVIVATSTEAPDDAIENYCSSNSINCFRGSLENVAERFLLAAKNYNLDYAVRINGDNLFADSLLIKEVVSTAIQDSLDFASNVPGRTYPTGMSVEAVKVSFYEEVYKKFDKNKYFEHVTLFLYEHPEHSGKNRFIKNDILAAAAGSKMAIDTVNDFVTAEKIINRLENNFASESWQNIFLLKKEVENE